MALPTPAPLGPIHKPVHHGAYVEMVENTLDQCGFEIKDQAFGVTNDGARFFGLMQIHHESLRDPKGTGVGHVIGLRGSHDQSIPRALAAGSSVFVCDNLAFSGELVVSTKHTTYIMDRLPDLIAETVKKLKVVYEHQDDQFDKYRLKQISENEADAAMMEMGRTNVIPWKDMGRMVKEWDEPTHMEHAEDGGSVWRLFNAATEVLKIRNPQHPRLPLLAERTVKLHGICDELALAA
jgi:hypothetical protein